jgi:hypothetical protein
MDDSLLMEMSIIETSVGNMFCFVSKFNQAVHMADELSPDSHFDFISLAITSTDGSQREYHTVGNSYDQWVIFTPKEHEWFTEGTVQSLKASMFTPGDLITVTISDRLEPKPGFAEKLWLLMTCWVGSGSVINWKEVTGELIIRK